MLLDFLDLAELRMSDHSANQNRGQGFACGCGILAPGAFHLATPLSAKLDEIRK